MKAHPENPYQDTDGSPKSGMAWKYADFEKEKEIERRASLSPEEVAKLEAADDHMSRKMNS